MRNAVTAINDKKVNIFLLLIKQYVTRLVGESGHSSTILNLGTAWRSLVSFTSLLLYPRGKSVRHPGADWMLWRTETSLVLLESNPIFSALQPVAPRYTELSRLPVTRELVRNSVTNLTENRVVRTFVYRPNCKMAGKMSSKLLRICETAEFPLCVR